MHSIENQAPKKIDLEEAEAKFDQLHEHAKKLAAYESSGLKKECEAFQWKLKQGVPSTSATTITKMLDKDILHVQSWIEAEAKGGELSGPPIQSLIDNLSGMAKQVKPVKRELAHTQEIEED